MVSFWSIHLFYFLCSSAWNFEQPTLYCQIHFCFFEHQNISLPHFHSHRHTVESIHAPQLNVCFQHFLEHLFPWLSSLPSSSDHSSIYLDHMKQCNLLPCRLICCFWINHIVFDLKYRLKKYSTHYSHLQLCLNRNFLPLWVLDPLLHCWDL